MSRHLAHNVRTVVCVSDRGHEFGGEHISANQLGQGMEHVSARDMHMTQEGEHIALEYYVVTYVVFKQYVTAESGALGGAIIRDLRVEAFLKEL